MVKNGSVSIHDAVVKLYLAIGMVVSSRMILIS